MSKISNWFRNTFLGDHAEAEPTDEASKTDEAKDEASKEQSEDSKEPEAGKAEGDDKSEGAEAAESDKDKAEAAEGEGQSSKTDEPAAEPKPEDQPADKNASKAKLEPEPEEFNVEDHLDEFFWYLKEHPVYTKMLLNSSEALGARSVPVFYNRFTDPQHRRMLLKKDIKETVKKHFGGDLEKACAEHGGWYDREYRVADAKGNPTEEKTPSPETSSSDGSSGSAA